MPVRAEQNQFLLIRRFDGGFIDIDNRERQTAPDSSHFEWCYIWRVFTKSRWLTSKSIFECNRKKARIEPTELWGVTPATAKLWKARSRNRYLADRFISYLVVKNTSNNQRLVVLGHVNEFRLKRSLCLQGS